MAKPKAFDDEVECGFINPTPKFGQFPIMTPKELSGMADAMNRALIRSKMKQSFRPEGNQLKKK